jgi:ADP-ribosylglycohydrolase
MDHAQDSWTLMLRELEQKEQSGYDVGLVRHEVDASRRPDSASAQAIERWHRTLESASPPTGWSSREPDDLDDIHAAALWTATTSQIGLDAHYEAKVLRAWQGRIVGNMLGKPVEGWPSAAIRTALIANDSWPLNDYLPPRTANSTGLDDYVECWTETTRGHIDGSARDDDVDYTILNLHVLRHYGRDFNTGDVAATWLEMLPYYQTFTAERVALRNLMRGDPVDAAASHRNPYREFIGAAIRADVFGYIRPGNPASAADLAYRDARLTHRANGLYSEQWCAALVAAAFTATSSADAVATSLAFVPRQSRLHQAVSQVVDSWRAGATWETTLDTAEQTWRHYNLAHAVNNAAVLTAGLLYGNQDFDRTIALTVCGGLDTDSNAATAGSVAGILTDEIPDRWLSPLHDTVRSAVFGYDRTSITTLAHDTVAVARSWENTSDAAASAPANAGD